MVLTTEDLSESIYGRESEEMGAMEQLLAFLIAIGILLAFVVFFMGAVWIGAHLSSSPGSGRPINHGCGGNVDLAQRMREIDNWSNLNTIARNTPMPVPKYDNYTPPKY